MNFSVFSRNIIGYKNEIKNKGSQDYLSYKLYDEGIICAVADGHSGEYFLFSDRGAQFACESLIEVMEKYIYKEKDKYFIEKLLEKRVIQYEICSKWRKKVSKHYEENMPRVFEKSYFRYGTTLLGLIIYKGYVLYLKLGDGDILLKRNNRYKKIFYAKNQTRVDSLPEDNAYKKIYYKIEEVNESYKDCTIVIYSDGYENSYFHIKDMIKDINEAIEKYKKNIFSRFILEKSYGKILTQLSEYGSKDDISIIFVNIL